MPALATACQWEPIQQGGLQISNLNSMEVAQGHVLIKGVERVKDALKRENKKTDNRRTRPQKAFRAKASRTRRAGILKRFPGAGE